jgi:hypothetical protein
MGRENIGRSAETEDEDGIPRSEDVRRNFR